jgi:hypothetical protein
MTVVGGKIEYCATGFEEYCSDPSESPLVDLHSALGKWQAVDMDGSSMTLELTASPDGLMNILLIDQDAQFCNLADSSNESRELRLTGQGTFVIDRLKIPDALAQCVNIDKEMVIEFTLEYDPRLDTLTDSTGITWLRR